MLIKVVQAGGPFGQSRLSADIGRYPDVPAEARLMISFLRP